MKAVIYARVSTKEQDKYSIESQINICRRYAAEKGFDLIYEYKDRGISATTADRPAFQKMIQNVLRGQADIILVYDFSRFARDEETSVIYKAMLRKAGKRVVSITQYVDESPAGRLTEILFHGLDEFYSRNLSQNTIRGMVEMARRGLYPGQLPIGYVRNKENKFVEVDPERGPLISMAFKFMGTGRYSLREFSQFAWGRGIKSKSENRISPSGWAEIFKRPIYMGEIHWRNEIYPGKHKPLTDKKTFNHIQTLLKRRSNGGAKKRHFYLLRKLLISSVYQKPMNGNCVRGSSGDRYYYYRAIGKGPEHNIPCYKIEDQISDYLKNIGIEDIDCIPVSEKMHLALLVAPHVGLVYQQLVDDTARRDFLNLIFEPHSIQVGENGLERVHALKPGFKIIYDCEVIK